MSRIITLLTAAAIAAPADAAADERWSAAGQRLYQALTAQFQDQSGDYSAAMQTMLDVAHESKEYEAYHFAYDLAIDALNYAQAEAAAQDWINAYPKDRDAHWALVRILLATNRSDAAYQELHGMLARNASPHQIARLSRYLTYLSDADARLALLKRLSDAFPNNPFFYYYVGLMAKEQGHIGQAIDAFEHAISLDGRWQQLRLMQAQTLSSIGRLNDARKLMDGLLKENGKDEYILSAYIDILVDHTQWRDARRLAKKWQQLNPQDTQLQQLVAWLASQDGALDEALKSYQSMLDNGIIDKDQYYFDSAEAYNNAGEREQAVSMLHQITPQSVLYMPAQQKIAIITFAQGNIELGQQRFRQLRQDFPDYALEMYLVELAQLDRKQEWAAGDALIQAALNDYPGQVDILYAKAEHQIAQGQNRQAMQTFARLLDLDPANIDALNAYGYLLLTEKGRQEEGAKMIRTAIADYPDAPAIQDSYAWLNYLQGNNKEALLWSRRAYAGYRRGEIVPHYIAILMANGQARLAQEVYQYARRAEPDNAGLQALKTQIMQTNEDKS